VSTFCTPLKVEYKRRPGELGQAARAAKPRGGWGYGLAILIIGRFSLKESRI